MRTIPLSRRSTYTPRLAAEVLRRIAEGESLSAICGPKRKKGMPGRLTVYAWLSRYPKFRQAYLLARMAQSELYADEMVAIADGGEEDRKLEIGRVRRDRLRVEVRRWRAAVLAPEVYARQLMLVRDGVEGDEALATPVMDEDERARRIAAILEGARRRGVLLEGEEGAEGAEGTEGVNPSP